MPSDRNRRPRSPAPAKADSEYALMLQLERLESLAEDMEELGVERLADVRARIAALHERLDNINTP